MATEPTPPGWPERCDCCKGSSIDYWDRKKYGLVFVVHKKHKYVCHTCFKMLTGSNVNGK